MPQVVSLYFYISAWISATGLFGFCPHVWILWGRHYRDIKPPSAALSSEAFRTYHQYRSSILALFIYLFIYTLTNNQGWHHSVEMMKPLENVMKLLNPSLTWCYTWMTANVLFHSSAGDVLWTHSGLDSNTVHFKGSRSSQSVAASRTALNRRPNVKEKH